jgi:polysaccharide deacetylase family protein (PEP-CTERM system associated)
MQNILSIDLEAYFCSINLSSVAPRDIWDSLPLRLERPVTRLLDIFDKHGCEATFFVLGWVAERIPHLVKEIENRGHEIATHGYFHQPLTEINAELFEEDLRHALSVTQPLVAQKIRGYRAPSFTVTPATKWAFEILERCGLDYDSSIFPITFHPDYGFPNAPLTRYQATESIIEIPISCIDIAGKRLPCSGGGYFRLLPYSCTRFLFRRCINAGRPVVFYLHPWEIDSEQPHYPIPHLKRLRHYRNLEKTEKRLDRLLLEFEFTSIRKILSFPEEQAVSAVQAQASRGV